MVFGAPLKKPSFLLYVIVSEAEGKGVPHLYVCCFDPESREQGNRVLSRPSAKEKVTLQPKALYLNAYI